MTFDQYVDIAVYQRQDAQYFKALKKNKAHGAFIQLNYGLGFPNPKAKEQIKQCIRYLDFTGCYAFFLGNPVKEANYFLAWLHYWGMDRTTPVMIDVEPNEKYNGPMTKLINQWTDIVYKDGYHNIFIYSMAHWFHDGHILPGNLKHGKIWAAAYGTDRPGVDNAKAWQYTDNWHGMHTDGDYSFTPLSELTGKGKSPKPKVVFKYVKHGHRFQTLADVNGYGDRSFNQKYGTLFKKGSVIKGNVVNYGRTTRIKTDSGYFSGNRKFMKVLQ